MLFEESKKKIPMQLYVYDVFDGSCRGRYAEKKICKHEKIFEILKDNALNTFTTHSVARNQADACNPSWRNREGQMPEIATK
jgi:hypothetical protein